MIAITWINIATHLYWNFLHLYCTDIFYEFYSTIFRISTTGRSWSYYSLDSCSEKISDSYLLVKFLLLHVWYWILYIQFSGSQLVVCWIFPDVTSTELKPYWKLDSWTILFHKSHNSSPSKFYFYKTFRKPFFYIFFRFQHNNEL